MPIADVCAGLFGVIGVLGALVERERTGHGQRVSTSLLAAQTGIHTFQATRYLIAGEVPGLSGNHHPTVAPVRAVRRGGRPAGHRGRQRGDLAALRATGGAGSRRAPVRGQRAAAGAPGGAAPGPEAAALAARPVAEWLALLAGAGVPAGRVKSLDGCTNGGPAQDLVRWTTRRSAGIRLPANPLDFSRSALAPGLPPPPWASTPTRSQALSAVRSDPRADPPTGQAPGPLYRESPIAGSLDRFGDETEAGNPAGWPGYQSPARRAQAGAGARHAVTTALAPVGGAPCVLVGFDFAFLGGSLGAAEGARIARAFSVAVAAACPSWASRPPAARRMQEGTTALTQMQAVAAAVAGARRAGIPHIAVAGDPDHRRGMVIPYRQSDVLIGVPGARVSFSGSRTRPAGADPGVQDSSPRPPSGRTACRRVVPPGAPRAPGRGGPRAAVAAVARRGPGPGATARLAGRQHRRRPSTGAGRGEADGRGEGDAGGGEDGGGDRGADGWTQVGRARSPARPPRGPVAGGLLRTRAEIRGDRCGGVDPGLRCGFGRHQGTTIAYIAQTGKPTTPAGFRTATRLLGLAGRLGLPVLTLIDTPGAAAAPGDEAAGIGPAIAELFVAVASSQVPITSVVIGEGVSGGALALASPGETWIARDGYLAVTAPELAASILKLGAGDIHALAGRLRLTPAELMARGIVRGIIQPPAAGRG